MDSKVKINISRVVNKPLKLVDEMTSETFMHHGLCVAMLLATPFVIGLNKVRSVVFCDSNFIVKTLFVKKSAFYCLL